MAVVVPPSFSLDPQVRVLISQSVLYNWYLVVGTGRFSQEVRLLAGLEHVVRPVFLLEGKLLTEVEANVLVPGAISDLVLTGSL